MVCLDIWICILYHDEYSAILVLVLQWHFLLMTGTCLSLRTQTAQNEAVVWTPFKKAATKIRLRVKVSKSFLILFVGFLWCLYTCYISVPLIFVQRTFCLSQFTLLLKPSGIHYCTVWCEARLWVPRRPFCKLLR